MTLSIPDVGLGNASSLVDLGVGSPLVSDRPRDSKPYRSGEMRRAVEAG